VRVSREVLIEGEVSGGRTSEGRKRNSEDLNGSGRGACTDKRGKKRWPPVQKKRDQAEGCSRRAKRGGRESRSEVVLRKEEEDASQGMRRASMKRGEGGSVSVPGYEKKVLRKFLRNVHSQERGPNCCWSPSSKKSGMGPRRRGDGRRKRSTAASIPVYTLRMPIAGNCTPSRGQLGEGATTRGWISGGRKTKTEEVRVFKGENGEPMGARIVVVHFGNTIDTPPRARLDLKTRKVRETDREKIHRWCACGPHRFCEQPTAPRIGEGGKRVFRKVCSRKKSRRKRGYDEGAFLRRSLLGRMETEAREDGGSTAGKEFSRGGFYIFCDEMRSSTVRGRLRKTFRSRASPEPPSGTH